MNSIDHIQVCTKEFKYFLLIYRNCYKAFKRFMDFRNYLFKYHASPYKTVMFCYNAILTRCSHYRIQTMAQRASMSLCSQKIFMLSIYFLCACVSNMTSYYSFTFFFKGVDRRSILLIFKYVRNYINA